MRIHHFLPVSEANGPGKRAVLWVQGCTLGCPGCFNPETHPTTGGQDVDIPTLAAWIGEAQQTHAIEGVTISGGEPLQQIEAVGDLVRHLRRHMDALSILIFTGYTEAEMERMPGIEAIQETVDVLVAGRYHERRHHGYALLGSHNQRILLLTDRYTLSDLEQVPEAEVQIGPDGAITLTGVGPLRILSNLLNVS